MTKDEIIERVGSEAFRRVVEKVWAKSDKSIKVRAAEALAELNDPNSQEDFDLLTDIVEILMETNAKPKAKIGLLFEVYREAPSFTLINELFLHYWRDLPRKGKGEFWRQVQVILGSRNDRLTASVEQALWCDFFETPEFVEEAWYSLLDRNPDDEVIKRILITSGPVPFRLKTALYERLLSDRKWHPYIYKSILHSAFDYYGDINENEARSMLSRLRLNHVEMEHWGKLELRLKVTDEI